MKRQWYINFILISIIVLSFQSFMLYAKDFNHTNRKITPLVSTDWLAQNNGLTNLVILDIRTTSEYTASHIQNSINVPFEVPFSAWITMRGDLLLEVPDEASLFNTIGGCGITKNSLIVIVTTLDSPPAPPYSPAGGTRVADTLIYAGLNNVAILDGGYPKWITENRPVTTVVPIVRPVIYTGKIKEDMFASVEYVERNLNRIILLDARDADVYFGVTIEPYAAKAGHIPSARSLPTPWMWNTDGTYKTTDELNEMASGIITKSLPSPWIWNRGRPEINYTLFEQMARGNMEICRDKEIIIYCGVGGYASSWWFVLTQMLGYEKVKIFDGAAQEWVQYNDMVKFTWTH